VVCGGRVAGRDVDRAQGVRHRRDRLHTGPHAQERARGHPALRAAGAVARPGDAVLGDEELVVGGRPAASGGLEAVADLDALDGLDAHERLRELRVQAPIPLHMGAEPRRQSVGEHLDDAAQRVARLLRVVDLLDHACGCLRVEAAQRVGVEAVDVVGRRPRGIRGHLHGSDRQGVADEPDAELGEEGAREGSESHAGGRLTGARALEDGARLVERVLLHADEVCVSRTRAGEGGAAAAGALGELDRLGAHHLDPLGPLGVADAHGDGAAEGVAVTHARGDRELVLFELHARSATVAELASGEVGLDGGARDGDTGRESLDERDEFGAVRFAGRQHAEHSLSLPRRGRPHPPL
jgi:hypothetical protein